MNPTFLGSATLAVALTASLAGCTSFPVETDYDPEIDFVRRAVDAALAAKGYRKTDDGSADFEVTYHVGVERQVDVQTYVDSYPRGYRWYSGPTQAYTTVREYDVGSLVLDIVSPSEKQLIWRGATQARINDAGTPEQREKRARAAVDAILAKFPPQ